MNTGSRPEPVELLLVHCLAIRLDHGSNRIQGGAPLHLASTAAHSYALAEVGSPLRYRG